MSKAISIAALVRVAARTEPEFHKCLLDVFAEESAERIAEFFDRLNIPRSATSDALNDPLPSVEEASTRVGTFAEEKIISAGIQKFLDRHEKKLKWHSARPSMEGAGNVLFLFRIQTLVTELRLKRLHRLMKSKDEFDPDEWAVARDIMNRAYLSFRHYLRQLAGSWLESMLAGSDATDFRTFLGSFYEVVDEEIRALEEHRVRIEERRGQLTVLPEGFDPVKPPNYFGGDLLGRGPWKQFWAEIETRSHHFREAVS
jgi:hypothetical protein